MRNLILIYLSLVSSITLAQTGNNSGADKPEGNEKNKKKCCKKSCKPASDCIGSDIITLDFNNKCFIYNECDLKNIKRGDFYKLKITGVNLNVYKVSINNEDSALTSALDLSQLIGFNTDAISGLLASITNSTNSAMVGQDNRTESIKLVPQGVMTQIEPDATMVNAVLKKINEFSAFIDSTKKELIDFQVDINSLMDEYYKSLNKLELEECPPDFFKCTDIDELYKEVSTHRNKLRTLYGDVIVKRSEINDSIPEYSEDMNKKYKLKEKIEALDGNFGKLMTAIEASIGLIKHEEVQKIAGQLANFANNASKEYESLPLQFTEDQTKLSIDITPHDSNSRLPSYSMSLTFPMYKRTYLAIGLGLYWSPAMNNEAYSVRGKATSDSTAGYGLVQEDVSSHEFGASVLVRYGWRFTKNGMVGAHLAGGTGFSFTNPVKPRIMLGGGMSFGDRHRATFDLGVIGGYVDRLSNAFSVDEQYTAKPENVLVSKAKWSGFLTVGYIYSF